MVKAIMDRVFVKLDEPEKVNGIILIDDVTNPRTSGVVVSVGEQVTSVKEGDHVLFHVFDELPTLDKDIVAVREFSLLGVFDE